MAAAAVAVISAHGTDADYEAGLNRFRTATTPQDQVRELYSLADYPTEALVRRSIELAFTDAVKTQNAPYLIGRCIANRDHGALAWRLLRERWDEAVARFPDNSIVRMIDALKTLSRPDEQADVAAFFAEHPIPQGAKQLAQILERQGVNVAMRQREAGTLTKAFS
jgi:puromycin-sensitive aminopeptidase